VSGLPPWVKLTCFHHPLRAGANRVGSAAVSEARRSPPPGPKLSVRAVKLQKIEWKGIKDRKQMGRRERESASKVSPNGELIVVLCMRLYVFELLVVMSGLLHGSTLYFVKCGMMCLIHERCRE
jgi:hypothetical protein